MTYGTLNLSANSSSVYVATSLTATGANGTGAGTVDLTGTSDDIYFEGNQTFDNATINLGSATGYSDYIDNDDTNNTGSVLTLGPNLVINDNSWAYEYMAPPAPITPATASSTRARSTSRATIYPTMPRLTL